MYFIVIITVLTIFLNYRYFKPENFQYNLSDKDLLTGSTWEFYQQGSLTDYLPVGAQKPDKIAQGILIVKGDAQIENFVKSSNKFQFKAAVKKETTIDVPIFDFSNWKVIANDAPIKHSNKGEFGTIEITLIPGDYLVKGSFENTLLRIIANSLSAIALGAVLLIYKKI